MFDPRTNSNTYVTTNHQSYGSFYLDQEQSIQFRPMKTDDDDSGVCSPPLWKSAATPSPPRSPSQPLLGVNNSYRSLSPNSRAQAIARGQMELMEMVKNMPESSYELSLKDIVEKQRIESVRVSPNRVIRRKESEGNKKKSVVRNGSFEIERKGLFLNMFFPVSLKSKKKESNGKNSVPVSVSPKNGGEKDWWKKKKFRGSSDSESSKTSSGSSGSTGDSRSSGSGRSDSSRRKKEGFLRGCWPFFESRSRRSV